MKSGIWRFGRLRRRIKCKLHLLIVTSGWLSVQVRECTGMCRSRASEYGGLRHAALIEERERIFTNSGRMLMGAITTITIGIMKRCVSVHVRSNRTRIYVGEVLLGMRREAWWILVGDGDLEMKRLVIPSSLEVNSVGDMRPLSSNSRC